MYIMDADDFTAFIRQHLQIYSSSFSVFRSYYFKKNKNDTMINPADSNRTSFHHASLSLHVFFLWLECEMRLVQLCLAGSESVLNHRRLPQDLSLCISVSQKNDGMLNGTQSLAIHTQLDSE